jgi:flagellar hook protein FlgE
MMTQAFYTGISGVRNQATGIAIVADNLENISTVGYRGNNYEFSSLFEKLINTDIGHSSIDSSVGVGVSLQATPMFEQSGDYQLTDRSTDLALFGNGWFGIAGENDPLYTRDGSFSFDANSNLVTPDGFYVLGTMGGNIANDTLTSILSEVPLGSVGAQKPLSLPNTLSILPEATKNATFSGNLGTADEVQKMSTAVIDATNNKNILQLTFTKNATQPLSGTQWNVVATTSSQDAKTLYDTQTGTLTFDNEGALLSSTLTSIDNNGTSVKIDLGKNFDGITAISDISLSASSSVDGLIGGELIGYEINKNAEVIASFSNGIQSSIAKIAVFHFQNDQGLERVSGSRFSATDNSGTAFFYKDANGNNITGADIANYKLEGSNITMTYGLTELIVLQRAYDANSKSITTADQMVQKALSMHK